MLTSRHPSCAPHRCLRLLPPQAALTRSDRTRPTAEALLTFPWVANIEAAIQEKIAAEETARLARRSRPESPALSGGGISAPWDDPPPQNVYHPEASALAAPAPALAAGAPKAWGPSPSPTSTLLFPSDSRGALVTSGSGCSINTDASSMGCGSVPGLGAFGILSQQEPNGARLGAVLGGVRDALPSAWRGGLSVVEVAAAAAASPALSKLPPDWEHPAAVGPHRGTPTPPTSPSRLSQSRQAGRPPLGKRVLTSAAGGDASTLGDAALKDGSEPAFDSTAPGCPQQQQQQQRRRDGRSSCPAVVVCEDAPHEEPRGARRGVETGRRLSSTGAAAGTALHVSLSSPHMVSAGGRRPFAGASVCRDSTDDLSGRALSPWADDYDGFAPVAPSLPPLRVRALSAAQSGDGVVLTSPSSALRRGPSSVISSPEQRSSQARSGSRMMRRGGGFGSITDFLSGGAAAAEMGTTAAGGLPAPVAHGSGGRICGGNLRLLRGYSVPSLISDPFPDSPDTAISGAEGAARLAESTHRGGTPRLVIARAISAMQLEPLPPAASLPRMPAPGQPPTSGASESNSRPLRKEPFARHYVYWNGGGGGFLWRVGSFVSRFLFLGGSHQGSL